MWWLEFGHRTHGALTGVLLGSGVATRIGYGARYLVPLSALATGSAAAGALVYGVYGATRGAAVAAVVAASFRIGHDPASRCTMALRGRATYVVAGAALAVAGLLLVQ